MVSYLKTYHAMPPPVRAILASARGYYLRWWRYGNETPGLVDQALDREGWDAVRWTAWRQSELRDLLARAASTVPHYRSLWRQRAGRREDLAAWPLLPKEAVRAAPDSFLADGARPSQMFREQTSGTTGKPVVVWWSRKTARAWYALFEARIRHWNGVSRADRWGMLGGQLVVPVRRQRPPFWVWNAAFNQLYLSSYHIAPANVAAYLEALSRHRVQYLFGYASSLYALAQLAAEAGLRAPRMRVAISNAEPLLDPQRARIAEIFDCPVRDTYGMAEIACGGSECGEGRMHLWPEVGVVEILRDGSDEPAPPGEPGRIVATGLLNRDMPLIRYETGDRGTLAPEGFRCTCGRNLPVLQSVEGRSDDVLVTPDGRRIGRLDPVFKGGGAIREAQIVQQTVDRVRVLVVPAPGFGEAEASSIASALGERLGPGVSISVDVVSEIPRTRAGKFRAVVSEVPRSGAGPERRP